MSSKSNFAASIDALGALVAQEAAIQKRIRDLKTSLIEAGIGTHEGELYTATVYMGTKETLDTKAATEKLLTLGCSHQWITSHTEKTEYTAVRSSVKRNIAVGKAA